MTVETFDIQDPVLVLRVCKLDSEDKLRPTLGIPTFEWPREGKVEDPKWRDNGACGDGLHGFLAEQILLAGFLSPNEERIEYLVVEVERSEYRLVGEKKVKFPRGNVLYAGSWRKCLEIFRSKGYSVPTEKEMMDARGWQRAFPKVESDDPLDHYSFPELGEWDEPRDGVKEGQITFEEAWEYRTRLLNGWEMTEAEAKHYAKQMTECNAAMRYELFKYLQWSTKSLFIAHRHIEKLMVNQASGQMYNSSTRPEFDSHDLFKWYVNQLYLPNRSDQLGSLQMQNVDPDDRPQFGLMKQEWHHNRNKGQKAYRDFLNLRIIFRLYGKDPGPKPLVDFLEK